MLIRLSYLFLILTLAIAAFLVVHFFQSDADRSAYFTGVDRCAACHTASSSGAQIGIWRAGPHASAYEVLLSDSARAYLSNHNDSLASCLPCHTTLGRPAFNEGEEALMRQGVSCERCHGAGSEYAYYDIMRDRAAFLAHGGVVGTLDDCTQCHAASLATSEHHCPFQLQDFVADSAWQRIRHPVPQDAVKPDTVLELRK